MTVYAGVDVLRRADFEHVRGRKVGLLTHLSAVGEMLIPTYSLLTGSPEVDVRALFTPEHGFFGSAREGELVNNSVDARTGLPVYSLYSEHTKPAREMFDGLDLIVVDLQDIGARCYTFAWTMSLMLEACAEAGLEMLVLDRPNPLNGLVVRGLLVEPNCTSMVGRYDSVVPLVHGMTLGELAMYYSTLIPGAENLVKVLAASGWCRSMSWRDTGLTWIPPSPAIPKVATADHYPGSVMIEGTTLSEGRGTALPFEIVGSPGIDPIELAHRLNMQHQRGVLFRPTAFRPTTGKHAGIDCRGVQAHIVEPRMYDPLRTWLNVIVTIRAYFPEEFGWAEPHNGRYMFDLLMGNRWARSMIDNDARVADILAEERKVCAEFEERRQPYLIYD